MNSVIGLHTSAQQHRVTRVTRHSYTSFVHHRGDRPNKLGSSLTRRPTGQPRSPLANYSLLAAKVLLRVHRGRTRASVGRRKNVVHLYWTQGVSPLAALLVVAASPTPADVPSHRRRVASGVVVPLTLVHVCHACPLRVLLCTRERQTAAEGACRDCASQREALRRGRRVADRAASRVWPAPVNHPPPPPPPVSTRPRARACPSRRVWPQPTALLAAPFSTRRRLAWTATASWATARRRT